MEKLAFAFLFFCFGCYSLPTLNQKEILKSTNDSFMPSQLEIAYEVEGLRLDIIRQTTHRKMEIPVQNHPLGFDLGNGLFYDMNQNLSLRIDKLLGIKTGEDYSIKKYYSNAIHSTISRERENGKFCEKGENFNGVIFEECSKLTRTGNILNFYWRGKEKLLYSIEQRGHTFMYFKPGITKPKLVMSKKASNQFTVGNTKKQKDFSLENQTLFLEGKYVIRQNESESKIQVFEKKRKKEKLIMTIKRGDGHIFIYDKNWRGLDIVLNENKREIVIYKNDELWFMMKRE